MKVKINRWLLMKLLVRDFSRTLKMGAWEGVKMGLTYHLEVFDNKDNMRLIGATDCHQLVVNQGLNKTLDVMFHNATQIGPWYCVISETDTAAAAGMTYAVPVFTEWQSYDEETRPEYEEAAASSQSITNSANKAVFTASATKTLYGAGLVGGGTAASTKADTAGGGTLFDYGAFGTAQPVIDGNVVNLTVTISAADDGA